jgi:putrescine aminotransferase
MMTGKERQASIVETYGKLINPSKAKIMSEAGLGIVEEDRSGQCVWDLEQKKYFDLRDDAGVYNLGRRPKRIINKLRESLEELDIGNNLFFSEPRIELAKKLGEISPGRELTGVTYGVSGGEIVDFALKLARATTKRKKIIAMEKGFYGCTGAAVTATANKNYREPFLPLIPDFVHVPFNDIEALKKELNQEVACVIVEPIQGHAGVKLPDENYFKELRKLCDQAGALMIVDEIQTAFGRTGKFFAIEHYGVVPDIITIGKAMSGGVYPITAALYKPRLLEFWNQHPLSHLSTFGGSDLGCVVALEVINEIEEEHLMNRAKWLGGIFEEGFEELKKKYSGLIKDFRHKGLLMAIEYHDEQTGPLMSRLLAGQGILSPYTYTSPNQMRLLPTLVLSDDEARQILEIFEVTLEECTTTLGGTGKDQKILQVRGEDMFV